MGELIDLINMDLDGSSKGGGSSSSSGSSTKPTAKPRKSRPYSPNLRKKSVKFTKASKKTSKPAVGGGKGGKKGGGK
tara:strand:+ start:139 stop:369 length:231 start_codon:yes stop_codon:yes gene_type:complete